MKLKLFLLPLILALFSAAAIAQQVTLAWDPNKETDLAGYKVYKATGTGGPYTLVASVGVLAAPTYTVTGLTNGTWYFAVTAFNKLNLESGYSNEVSTTIAIPPAPPQTLRIVTQQALVLSKKNVDIAWTTNEPADGLVEYGFEGQLSMRVTLPQYVSDHTAHLSGMKPNRIYAYRITSRSQAGDTISSTGSFYTR